MRVVLYARVSTQEQSSSGHSLDAQMEKLRAYAALYDHQIVEEIRDAESAKSLRREGLQAALRMLKANQADGIVVAKLDRLTRSVRDWGILIDDYFGERAGKSLFAVHDSIDTSSASGRLVLNVLLSVNQWEREAIAERTSAALQHKISKGERCGRVRYGYSVGPDGKTLVPNETEQRAIALMIDAHASGLGLRETARDLTSRGYPTRDGKPWDHSQIRVIIRRVLKDTPKEVA